MLGGHPNPNSTSPHNFHLQRKIFRGEGWKEEKRKKGKKKKMPEYRASYSAGGGAFGIEKRKMYI